jgi:putative tryptophan/tyrosine transport system substrate-binding protein
MMGRRDFITLLGGAAAWPLAARAQRRKVPIIGAFHAASREGTAHLMAAYREGLKEESYIEGQNVAIEYRWADGVLDRMPAITAELVRLRPDVITAFGTAARAAHDARAVRNVGMSGHTANAKPTRMTQLGHSPTLFAVMHNDVGVAR